MTSTPGDQREFERLVGRLLDSSLDQSESSRLEELLRSDPSRVLQYRELVEVDVLLEAEAAVPYAEVADLSPSAVEVRLANGMPPNFKADSASEGHARSHAAPFSPLTPTSNPASLRSTISVFGGVFAVAAACLLCWSAAAAFRSDPAFVVEQLQGFRAPAAARALTVGETLAVNSDVAVEAGCITLKTRAGVRIFLEGPSALRTLADGDVRLLAGKARVRVPEAARGFVLYGPGVRVTDLGTEFGVVVADSGVVTTEVYEGRVLLEALEEKGGKPVELDAGWAGRVSNASQPRTSAYHFGSGAKAIEWAEPSQACVSTVLATRPEFYHRFDELYGHESSSLVNGSLYKCHLSGDARLVAHGPDRTLGGRGHALEFSGSGAAEISLGMAEVEQTAAYTIAMWVRPDRLETQNIIVATNHQGPNKSFGPQLRMLSDGSVQHYLYSDTKPHGMKGDQYFQRSKAKLKVGEWRHLAITASTGGVMQLLIDGRPADSPRPVKSRISGEYARLILGTSSGTYRAEDHHMQAYVGAVDELVFFSRPLPVAQIASLHEASRKCFEEGAR